MKTLLKILIVLAALGTLNCGPMVDDPREFTGINGDFLTYLERFEETYGLKVHFRAINYKSQSERTLAVCKRWADDLWEIQVDPEAWAVVTEIQKTTRIFHELGHCIFDRGHEDSLLEDNCAASLMNTYEPSKNCLDKHWEYYVEELGQY